MQRLACHKIYNKLYTASNVKHIYNNYLISSFISDTLLNSINYMSRLITKSTKWHVRPAKTMLSLIRVFAVMKKAWVLTYPLNAQRRLIGLGGCPGCSESSLDAHSFCWFYHEVAHMSLKLYIITYTQHSTLSTSITTFKATKRKVPV